MTTALAPAPTGTYKPTDEQQNAVDLYADGKNVTIIAGAGSGKTATLRFLADTAPERKGLYLAFNKSVQVDAQRRFAGTKVEPRTVNSLAYAQYGRQFKRRMDQKYLMPHEKKHALGMVEKKFEMGTTFITWQKVIQLAGQTVETYCRSFRPDIELDMVVLPPTILGPKPHRDQLREVILKYAKLWWQDLMNPDGQIEHSHSPYMKRWSLDYPQLPYDYLLVDEAQDLDGLTRGVLLSQNAETQVITVGDPNQAIYGWRGATNALDDFEGERTFLTQSFRFGDAIAARANFWLALLDSEMRIQGLPGKKSSVWPSTKRRPEAILTRTNGGAISEVIEAQKHGLAVGVAGERKKKELIDLANAALDLQKTGKTRHRELDVFSSWDEVVNYVSEDGAGTEIAALVRVVDSYGAPAVVRAMESTVPTHQADQTVSTVHVAKGLEWFQVRISDDFREPGFDKNTGEQKPLEPEEARLCYVAVTRAERHLDDSGLDWAKTMTGGVGEQ